MQATAVWASLCAPVDGQTVWPGLSTTFTKPGFADYTLPEYQDRITSHVILTRKSTQSIFNIAQEPGATQSLSPKDTTWATGVMPANTGLTISAAKIGRAHV